MAQTPASEDEGEGQNIATSGRNYAHEKLRKLGLPGPIAAKSRYQQSKEGINLRG